MGKEKGQLQASNRILNQELEIMQGKRRNIPTASKEEAEERKASMRTQGKKGAKLTRINAAFTPDNIEYIKIMGRIRGESMSEFINHVLDKHRSDNADFYEQAKAIKEST